MAEPFPRLTRLGVRGFLSYREAETTLAPLTFFLGRNGAGKTNLLDALRWFVARTSPGWSFVRPIRGIGRRGKEETARFSFEIGTTFGTVYAYSADFAGTELQTVREETLEVGSVERFPAARYHRIGEVVDEDPSYPDRRILSSDLALRSWIADLGLVPVLSVLSAVRDVDPSPAELREPAVLGRTRMMGWNGANAAVAYDGLTGIHREGVLDAMRVLLPDLAEVRVEKVGDLGLLAFDFATPSGKRSTHFATTMSDGALRAFGILVGLYSAPAGSVLLLEEPEIGIHPSALGGMLDALLEVSQWSQILTTTQSPELLANDQVRSEMLRIVEMRNGESLVSGVSPSLGEAMDREIATAGAYLSAGALERVP